VCGASSYPRKIDFAKFAEIAQKVGALLLADIAHIAGLIAAGYHPSCFPYADIVTSTTHKTLRGPRGGFILAKKEYAQKINSAVFPGVQGGPFEQQIAAKAVCFFEAAKPSFKQYIRQVVKNAQVLAETLKENEINLISGGTDNHLLLIDLTALDIFGQKAQELLEEHLIFANKNVIPNDARKSSDPSGLRLGTPALTTRGYKEEEFKIIGNLIATLLKNKKADDKILQEVKDLAKKYPLNS